MRKSIDSALGNAWNIQGGRKVYPMSFSTSDIDGIKFALKENGYAIVRNRWADSVQVLLLSIWLCLVGYICGKFGFPWEIR